MARTEYGDMKIRVQQSGHNARPQKEREVEDPKSSCNLLSENSEHNETFFLTSQKAPRHEGEAKPISAIWKWSHSEVKGKSFQNRGPGKGIRRKWRKSVSQKDGECHPEREVETLGGRR